jgi:hypothetical protein
MSRCLVGELLLLASRGTNLSPADQSQQSPADPFLPSIAFEWNRMIGEFEFTQLKTPVSRARAHEIFLEGLRCLHHHVPTLLNHSRGQSAVSPIRHVRLGELPDQRRLVTASSPQEPGTIWFAANWDTLTTRRIAGNVLHEAVHQLLYHREGNDASLLRTHSIAYSPWKQRERPGRWVWHAFWTFSAHCVFLADTITARDVEFNEDKAEVGNMYLRLKQCFDSLEMFDVVIDPEEARAIKWAATAVAERIENSGDSTMWGNEIRRQKAVVEAEFDNWVRRMISAH